MTLYLRFRSVETMISLLVCLLIVSSRKVTNGLENQMEKVLGSSLQVEVGYIFAEGMEIIIKNNFTDSDVKLEYSKIKMDDKNLEESEFTTVIKMGNKTEDMFKLTKLDPNSTYKICAVVNESSQEIYACEMATTFNHINNRRGFITGAITAVVAAVLILIMLGVLHALKVHRQQKFSVKNNEPSSSVQQSQINIISEGSMHPFEQVQVMR